MFAEVVWGPEGSMVVDDPIEVCPVCHSDRVFPVGGYDDRYRCEACARCWSPRAHGAQRVDPVGCPGCDDRNACFDRLRAEFPPWGTALLD